MLPDGKHKTVIAEMTRLVHAENWRDAARCVLDFAGMDVKIEDDDPKNCLPPIQWMFHWMLNNGALEEAAQLLWTRQQFDPRPQCSHEVWNLFDQANFGLIMGASSVSKCLSPETVCRMADGSLKAAEAIAVGDLLAGDDGTPRTVLHTVCGEGEMFDVKPQGAPSFRCNSDHVLSLVCCVPRRNHGGLGGLSSKYVPGMVVDVPVVEYLRWSQQRKKAYRLFFRPASFPETQVPFDPYIYGAWLGDGGAMTGILHTPEGPMARAWKEYFEGLGYRVSVRADNGSKCKQWRPCTDDYGCVRLLGNPWTDFVRTSLRGDREKFILGEYLENTESVRLGLLAGLIDSDGCAVGAGFDIVTRWERLADDIEALARGLGFKVSRAVRVHTIKSISFSGEYHHIFLRGDCSRIPTREKRSVKKSSRELWKGFPTSSFSVTPLGFGKFSGFALDGNHRFLLGSGIVTHNSYTMGVRLFMEWLRDPEWTTVQVVGPSSDHLEQNLFSHMVALHRSSRLPLPGEIGELYIGLDRRNYISSISGVIIPVGQTKKAGRLQGSKRKPRKVEHPEFGPLSRKLIFLDEIENVPLGIWFDLDNVMSNLDVENSVGLKIFGAYNPTNPHDEVGKRAEPPFGWADFNPDKHFHWKSKRGWDVLRLDGERCENVVQNRVVYPGLQTRAGIDQLARNSGGKQSAGYFTFGRGMYPPQGVELTVFPPGMLAKARGEFIWLNQPVACGSCDLALEGGAAALFSLGKWGLATGVKYPPSVEHPNGHSVMFKGKDGKIKPRYGLLLEQQFPLQKGETVAMKSTLIKTCKNAGIAGNLFCVDRTGHGQGIFDLARYEWSNEIIGVNYSEGSTSLKVMQEDDKPASELYDRVCSELWFAMRAWMDFGFLLIHPQVNLENLAPQLTNRKFRTVGGKNRVESKKDYKSRGFQSPDEADSATLLVHGVRVGSQVIMSMARDASAQFSEEDDRWYDDLSGVRIDPSNVADCLNESETELL